jgi:hypothetical protein
MALHFDMGMLYTTLFCTMLWRKLLNRDCSELLTMVSGKGSHDWFFQCYELLHPGVILEWLRDSIKRTLSSRNLPRPPENIQGRGVSAVICRWCLCGVVVIWTVINWEVVFQPAKCLSAFRRTVVLKFSYTITLKSLKYIFVWSMSSSPPKTPNMLPILRCSENAI